MKQSYTKEELEFFENKLQQKEFMLRNQFGKEKESYKLLDIGCGEGLALAHFRESGFDVTGIDFSVYGVLQHNPQVADCIIVGDCEEILPRLIDEGKKFDVINMDSFVELMVNLHKVILLCREILEEEGVLLVKVANNFSPWQQHLIEEGKLLDTYWVDKGGRHPSFFNKDGLLCFMEHLGYECVDLLGDSFIDFNLANEDTNYYEKQGGGKNCYRAHVDIENFMHALSVEKSVEVFRAIGAMGIGRRLIGIFQMEKE